MATHNDTVELIRAANQCRAALTVIIDALYTAGRPELSEPFALMLATLAQADFEALGELDVLARRPQDAPPANEYTN